jgi:hypothetical protein
MKTITSYLRHRPHGKVVIAGLVVAFGVFWAGKYLVQYIPVLILSQSIASPLTVVFLGEDTGNASLLPSQNINLLEKTSTPFFSVQEQWDRSLVLALAKQEGRDIQWIAKKNIALVDDYLIANPKAIAIGLVVAENEKFHFFPAYRENRQVLIAPSQRPIPAPLIAPPSSPSELAENADTADNSLIGKHHQEVATPSMTVVLLSNNPEVAEVRSLLRAYPQFTLQVLETNDIQQLIDWVGQNPQSYGLVAKGEWSLLSQVYPLWEAKLSFEHNRPIAWKISASAQPEWIEKVEEFFSQSQRNGLLLTLAEQHNMDFQRLDPLDLEYFERRKKLRLEGLKLHFIEAAVQTQQSPYLLMALSYQESQWDASLISHSGAQGLMMINAPTAEFLNLPEQPSEREQILAGARYLQILRHNLSALSEPDRTLIALTGYNIGPGALSRLLRQYLLSLDQEPAGKSILNENSIADQPIVPSSTLTTTMPSSSLASSPLLMSLILSTEQAKLISWPKLRFFMMQQVAKGRLSGQPILLTERVRIFESLLETQRYAAELLPPTVNQ